MEPVLPPTEGRFESTAIALHREATALAGSAHPTTRAALAKLLRVVNSFYSNLIEGIRTTPSEIQAALRANYSHDPGRAALQRLAVAHIDVEEGITQALANDPALEVTSPDFIRKLHRDLYAKVPDSERIVRSPAGRETIVVPGEFRTEDVTVGHHLAPPFASVPAFLNRFYEAYRSRAHNEVRQVVAFAASHHRLTWIHPFLDGNGRVTRLMTTAYARRIELDGGGLWSLARGFARYQSEYYAALAAADGERRTASDGRGALSLAALEEWIAFVVRTALDQISYMRTLLVPETLADRLRAYAAFMAVGGSSVGAQTGPWRAEAGDLLGDLVSRGSLPRAKALRYLPGKERTARGTLSTLLSDGILEADHHRGPVRLAFPPQIAQIVFPDLMTAPVRSEVSTPATAPDAAAARGVIPARSTRQPRP